jgi:hypothetical protein
MYIKKVQLSFKKMGKILNIVRKGLYYVGTFVVTTTICGLMQIPALAILLEHTQDIRDIEDDVRYTKSTLEALMKDRTQDHI